MVPGVKDQLPAGVGIARARRLIIKIGSALLVDEATGALRTRWLAALAEDIARCHARGQEVIVVSSGAVAAGRERLGLSLGDGGRALRIEDKQAAAATGQIRLAHAWQNALAHYDITIAQILLTLEDTEIWRRHLNARSTVFQLLKYGAVPVINENDTLATNEIRFGDNDRLAARVAQMVTADTLVLLSDIDGLYTANPRRSADARHVPVVDTLSDEVVAMAGGEEHGYSTGGMVTKLAAARICMEAGCRMVIAHGHAPGPLTRLESGERCTWFLPQTGARTARKRWIAAHLDPAGALHVDAGAVKALSRGKSLLPAGVTGVRGEFRRGDPVDVIAPDGTLVARGLSAYDSAAAQRIMGHRSADIAAILGLRGRDEMIHRDNMVFLHRPGAAA